jgi:fructokinase
VDVGGTKVEGSLISENGGVHRTLRGPSPDENKAMLALIEEMVRELRGDTAIAGVGFSIPGSIDPETGLLRNAPNSPAINGTPLARDLEERLPHPLFFHNDANCLVLSETRFGAARGYSQVVGIIMGTGTGAGVIHEGRLFHTPSGLAPEPGHLPLKFDGRPCMCGLNGCVEAYLSGPSILRRYHEIGGKHATTLEIFENERGDPAAAAVLAETRMLYARFIAMLVSIYNPEVIVLGGGLSHQPMYYQQEELIAHYSFGTNKVPPILPAKGGDASGKLGAATLVFDHSDNP